MTNTETQRTEWILFLKNGKAPAYILLSKMFIVFGIVIFSSLLLSKEKYQELFVFLILSFVYLFFRKRMKSLSLKPGQASKEFLIFIAILFLVYRPLMGILFLIAAVFFAAAIKQHRFVISSSGVLKDFFPKKEYPWEDIDNLVLNSGVLTINFRDLKIIQGYLANNEHIDQKDFNKTVQNWGEKEK